MKHRVLAIVGPTACGKTEISLALRAFLPIEILCMDSMQIYRGMDIGTAKPTKLEQSLVPHHMLDIADPWEEYSVAAYRQEAMACIDAVIQRGNVPVLVGGTGMYLRALSLPMDYGDTKGDEGIRRKYEELASSQGNDALHALLMEKDSVTANRLHPNDVRRVVRALEVLEITGQHLSSQRMPRYEEGPYRILPFAPDMDRQLLYDRINLRARRMMEEGLIEEIAGLLRRGVPENAQSMQGIGYKEVLPYLKAEQSLEETILRLQQRTRNYAKRQLTWFRADERITWMRPESADNMAQRIATIYREEPHES